jgi:hypothetical protein
VGNLITTTYSGGYINTKIVRFLTLIPRLAPSMAQGGLLMGQKNI